MVKNPLMWDSLLQLTGQLLEGKAVLEDLVAETEKKKFLALLDRGFSVKRKRSPRNHHKPSSSGGGHRSPNNFNQPASSFPVNPHSKPNPNNFKKTSAILALPLKKRWRPEIELGESSSTPAKRSQFPVDPAVSEPNPHNFKKTSANLAFPLNPQYHNSSIKKKKKKRYWSEVELGESSSSSAPKKRQKKHLRYIDGHVITNNHNIQTQTQTTCVVPGVGIQRRIEETGGSSAVCVIEKALFRTDVTPGHCRLSVPLGQVGARFLYPDEMERLLAHSGGGIRTTLIQPCLKECYITLALWDTNATYVLKNKWNVVFQEEKNKLWEGVVIRLWAFRRNNQLCFALERL